MDQDNKYFVFDEQLLNQGYMYNCICEKGCLKIDSNAVSSTVSDTIKAIYISKALDSKEVDTVWHRMKLNIDIPGDSAVTFSYFATQTLQVDYNNETINLPEMINSPDMNMLDKLSILDEFFIEQVKNPMDLLLFKAKGRYLYFKIELISHDKRMPSVKGLSIEFPMHSFVEYLPEFYKNNTDNYNFLSRFLGIFQSLYLDLDEQIKQISRYFDLDFVDTEFLHYLAKWVAVEDISIWSEDKLRLLIKNSFKLYKLKGTKQGLSEIVELYTGKKPIIIETYKIMQYYDRSIYDQMYKNLYGQDGYCFCLIVDEQAIKNHESFLELNKIVELYKPAHTIANVILLKPSIVLGQHTYIGINSNISEKAAFKLNDSTTIPFNTTIFD